ncbi:MAG: M28 family peptidase [Bacteroidales bacterium]|nr:M28 family peptidase [Bacteroidales bacterium]MBR1781990.1 M28 family peptidase [Bacteroidales bacterium]
MLLVFSCPALAQRYSISPVNADQVLSADSLRASVEYLCAPELGGRATGTDGGRAVADWLEGEFRVLGLRPLSGAWMHGFSTSEGLARNIMGLIPGSYTPSRYVVLMAHFDNLGTLNGRFYPGADANASGVAALLQLARMVTQMNTCHKIYGQGLILVALDAKEKNQGGAERLWQEISAGKLLDPVSGQAVSPSQISLVVNLDQLGGTQAPLTKGNPRFLMMLSDDATGRRSALESANKDIGLNLELGYDYYGSKDFTRLFYRRVSDQRIFLEHGIPAVMFTSGITLLNNKPTDTPDSLDYEVLRDRVRLIFYWLHKVL